MTRRKKDALRPLTEEESNWLEKISHSQSEPAAHVIRAKGIMAVAAGKTYTEAAHLAEIKSGDTLSKLVERFNDEGLGALHLKHGGGPVIKYSAKERERV